MRRRHGAVLGVTVSVAALVAACATPGRAPSSFGDGRAFGVQPEGARKVTAFRSTEWDVALDLAPGTATVTEQDDSWAISNQQQASPESGQFLLMVLRSGSLSGAEPRAVARVLRDQDTENGLEVTEVTDAEFMGRPAALYASAAPGGVFNVTLLTVSGSCAYVLNVTRLGAHEQLVDYFGTMLHLIHTSTGAPVDAPACR